MLIKYSHTNLIAKNWRKLARFYEKVFECIPVLPERDLSGEWIEGATSVEQAHITGMHMRLPGFGDKGPTLEIFSYNTMPDHAEMGANSPGFTHIAFAVDDVPAKAAEIFAWGDKPIGDLVVRDIPGLGRITFQYVADPEGNILEIQNVEKTVG